MLPRGLFFCVVRFFFYLCTQVNKLSVMRNFLLCFTAIFSLVLSSCESADNAVLEPKLEITSDATLRVDEAGGLFTIEYTVTNPVEGQSVEVKVVNAAMITATNTDTFGQVKVSISENTSEDIREGAVILNYGTQSATVVVQQEGNGGGESPVERIDITATSLVGLYYGDHLAEGLGHYWLIISEEGIVDGNVVPNSEFFRIDILGPLAADTENITIPVGEYIYDYYNSFTEYTVLNLGNTDYTYVDDAGEGWATPLDRATLNVEGSRFELVAVVADKEYHVTFEGDYTISNSEMSDTISNLTSDLAIDVSNCYVTLNSYGDYWHCGYCNWVVEFIDKRGYSQGVELVLDLLGTTLDSSSGFLGTYHSAGFSAGEPNKPNFGPGVFVPGVRISDDGVYMQGSLYQRYVNGKGIDQAPLHNGTITISDNGDGTYRIVVDAVDDATPAHKITLDWSGIL